MDVNYSSLDTIENYGLIFKELAMTESQYGLKNNYKQLIYTVAGLGLTNSIHERFIKCILAEYSRLHSLSKTKMDKLIRQYKSPKNIVALANDLQLDLEEAFNLEKKLIQNKYAYITNVESILNVVSEQRKIRNDYLHGDFSFTDAISYGLYSQQVTEFHEIHNFIFKIFRYSFNSNLGSLPKLV